MIWQPRLKPLLLALMTTLCLLGWAEWILSPKLFQKTPLSWLLTSYQDDYTYISYQIHQNTKPSHQAEMVFLGGSSLREILPDQNEIDAALHDVAPPAVKTHLLASRNQSFTESLALVLQLAPPPGSVVIFQMSSWRYSHGLDRAIEEIRMPWIPFLDPKPMQKFLASLGTNVEPSVFNLISQRRWLTAYALYRWYRVTLLNGQLDTEVKKCLLQTAHLHFSKSCWNIFLNTPWTPLSPPYNLHNFEHRHQNIILNDAKKNQMADWLRYTYTPIIQFHADFTRKVILELLRVAKEREWHIFLVTLPHDSRMSVAEQGLKSFYEQMDKNFQQAGGHIVSFVENSTLKDNDFYDHTHVTGPGRELFKPTLLQFIKQAWRTTHE
ncbi:MAG: hypothetical protein H7832_04115 [Magnetococcus sp. DMHC-6]